MKIWDKLMRLPLCYYDTESANDLVSRVTSDPGSASTSTPTSPRRARTS